MLFLALDTSAIASAAVIDGGVVRAEYASESTKDHAELLAENVHRVLANAVPEAIITGVGPGPFTGLRAGIMTARALAFAWDIPLFGVCSLDAIAHEVLSTDVPQQPFLVASDARRREVYWAQYAPDGSLLAGPDVSAAADLPAEGAVYGFGAGLYREVLGDRVSGEFATSHPTAASLGLAAVDQVSAALAGHAAPAGAAGVGSLLQSTPLYLRESDAKVPGARKTALGKPAPAVGNTAPAEKAAQ